MDIIKLNVHACAGGWCTRERQHRQWRNGQPWASGSSGWWTFLRRRWSRGRYACRDALRGPSQRWTFRKICPRSWRNPKRALALAVSHVAPSKSGFSPANHAMKFVNHHLSYIHYRDGVASCKSYIFGRKKQNPRKLELWVVKAIFVKLASA